MHQDERDLLEVLKAELEFLESGGYARDLTGDFCASGGEREFTLEVSWYGDEEIQAEQIVTLRPGWHCEPHNGTLTTDWAWLEIRSRAILMCDDRHTAM